MDFKQGFTSYQTQCKAVFGILYKCIPNLCLLKLLIQNGCHLLEILFKPSVLFKVTIILLGQSTVCLSVHIVAVPAGCLTSRD